MSDSSSQTDAQRISKCISHSGYCSRRDAERLIEAGRVELNGKRIKTPAINVTDQDVIMIDGVQISGPQSTALWLYYKPAGLVTTHRDEQNRPTVFEHLPNTLPRVISVGRLDMNSEGLLLLTNDGELSSYLESPQTAWQRRYRVRMHGYPSDEQLRQLKKGITIDDINYRSIKVEREKDQSGGANVWAIVTLSEGKNREIRKVFEHLGCPVSRLIRISFGPFQLGSMKEGEVKKIDKKALQNALGKGFKVAS